MPSAPLGLSGGGEAEGEELECAGGVHAELAMSRPSDGQGSLRQWWPPQPRAHLPKCLPRAVLPGAREQQKCNYRYLFFQPSPQPVFGRLEQGNFGPLPDALGNNTVFTLCLSLRTPRLLWGQPLRSHRGWGIRAVGGLEATVPSVPQDVLKFGALHGHGLFGIAVGTCLPLVAWWVFHVAVVPAPVLAVAVMGGPP